MKITTVTAAVLACSILFAASVRAETTPPVVPVAVFPSPGEIVTAAPAADWTAISPSDLLVMDLAPDAQGKARRVVIQLMPAPFSQGWIGNIRKLATAKWWDGTSINRVQDNYVVQWGDATDKKALPEGLETPPEGYSTIFGNLTDQIQKEAGAASEQMFLSTFFDTPGAKAEHGKSDKRPDDRFQLTPTFSTFSLADGYAPMATILGGWPFGYWMGDDGDSIWPVHCYGMVGVGRNYPPDTGTGAELYTVIGHAPRHLDRNIALVGRVIEGIEHLSSLPRGTGGLGFYESEAERAPITSVRIGADASDLPAFEYLSTESPSFAAYADARANRRDPFFIQPAGGADICNIPVPVRRKKE